MITTAQSEHAIEVDGRSWSYRCAGTGDPVLILDPPAGAEQPGAPAFPKPFEALLGRWRLIVPEVPTEADDSGVATEPQRGITSLIDLLAALDIGRCSVIARGSAAPVALLLATDHDHLVDKLVLESPVLDVASVERLTSVESPTLVLLGQRTEQATPGRTGVFARLPGSTVALIYDAGSDIRGDRPSAYAAAVTDYLERGQAFVVNTRSSVIHG